MKSLFTPEEFFKINVLPLKNSMIFDSNPEEFHNFYNLPQKNSTCPQPRGCKNLMQ